ncbi:AmmeMemoRadiSam system protein A [Thermanaerovibrio velox]|nr:AmmeMemoRadiSam system protein A [Thermanaerovibrio velox]
MPHPPILVPQVGRGRELEAEKTLWGIKRLGMLLPYFKDETAIIMSPHFTYLPGHLIVGSLDMYSGDLSKFSAPEVSNQYVGNSLFAQDLLGFMAGADIPAKIDSKTRLLDHGTFVPLALLEGYGRRPAKIVPLNPVGLSPAQSYDLGRRLRDELDSNKADFGILFSGDLSHRLSPDAPCGFSPFGNVFDNMVIEALSSGDPSALLRLGEEQLYEAGQCGLNSVLAFIGMAQQPLRVLSYEGPFGVGYAVAVLRPKDIHHYVDFARLVLMDLLDNRLPDIPILVRSAGGGKEVWDQRSGCFVSLYTLNGQLRGCIGTIEPTRPSIALEIANNAAAAAFEDPRFSPVKPEELPNLKISVDVLSPLEDASIEDLNPKVYGVVVRAGRRRGVLLPDINGVDTVQDQLSIAKRKAGIGDHEEVKIQRFTVRRYKEP